MAGHPAHDGQVLLDEQHRHDGGDGLQGGGDLGDDLRGEALRRLVDEQQPVRVEQHPADRQHLLLAAGQGAGPLPGPLAQLREQPVHGVVVGGGAGALGEPEVLRDGEPGEDATVLGHVAEALPDEAERGLPGDAGAVVADPAGDLRGARHEAEHGLEGGGLADAVAAEQRRDPCGCTLNVTPCRMCDPPTLTDKSEISRIGLTTSPPGTPPGRSGRP
ncbi:hypothetical protein GCM10027610_093790 [Dactylosporangium cerinum]